MAVVTTKSGLITNRDASPRVINNSNVDGGNLRSEVGTVETTATDSSASLYLFFQVPSNARLDQVLLYSDDVGTTGLMDIGIWRTTQDGGAVVDADFIASAVNLNSAALNGTDVTHESAVFGLEDAEKPLWQALGLSADPKIFYDVVGQLTEAVTAAGTLTLKCRYAI